MKKYVVGLISLIMIISCATMVACKTTPSTAVTAEELMRENYAAEMEAEHDKMRTHPVEIPDAAETIEYEDEEWIVIRSAADLKKLFNHKYTGTVEDLKGNYILADDINCKDVRLVNENFEGKFNGNNYKLFNISSSGGSTSLFYDLQNAVVENIVISSANWDLNIAERLSWSFIAASAHNSTIKNCVNYFQSINIKNRNDFCGGFIGGAIDCRIDNCVNYGDFIQSYGGILEDARNCIITNCKNYGNLLNYGNLSDYEALGGIVSYIRGDTVIENCENYGHIIGKSRLGGIVGSVWRGGPSSQLNVLQRDGLSDTFYTEDQIIKDCKNYGGIYLLKEEGDKRIETTGRENSNSDEDKKLIYEIGGIAGSITSVENCVNEGNFYGFENMGRKIKVDYLGGVVGAAKQVTNCENKGTMKIQKGREKNVGDICGFLDN